MPLDAASEWVPGDLAATISRADAGDPGLWHTLAQHGHQIASVRQTITAGVAGSEDADRLDVSAGSPLLLIRRLAFDAAGRPLALSDHRYLAHRFSLEVEFNGWSAGTSDTPGLRQSPA